MSDALDDAIGRLRADLEIELAPGVFGFLREFIGPNTHTIEIASLRAAHEGNGDVGRYLDSLPKDQTVVVPLVTSERLAGMLDRRGYRKGAVMVELYGIEGPTWVEAWIRKAS